MKTINYGPQLALEGAGVTACKRQNDRAKIGGKDTTSNSVGPVINYGEGDYEMVGGWGKFYP